jgi:hypothetical protein
MVVVCCYHFSSLLFVFTVSRVVFLKYIALKHTLFSVHTTIKHIFLQIRITAFTVGYIIGLRQSMAQRTVDKA